LFNGGPISSPWIVEHADAVLECWYPGVRGGSAIVDVLFGRTSPSGRMPVTTVASVDDLPLFTDWNLATPPGRTHRYFTGTPLIPFGWGLSYVDFRYDALAVSPPTLAPTGESVTVAARVTHAGGMALAADEVVMLFAGFQAESTGLSSVPRQQLIAFERLHSLMPGESRNVSFLVPRSALALVDAVGAMRVQSGEWKLWLGGGPPTSAGVLHGSLIVQ
jgi:beta-glucosidase